MDQGASANKALPNMHGAGRAIKAQMCNMGADVQVGMGVCDTRTLQGAGSKGVRKDGPPDGTGLGLPRCTGHVTPWYIRLYNCWNHELDTHTNTHTHTHIHYHNTNACTNLCLFARAHLCVCVCVYD